MINLIGCSKENFYKLLELMHYKLQKKQENQEDSFIYKPIKNEKNKKEKVFKKSIKNNPFKKLSELRFR